MMLKISVIITAYNLEKYIQEALQSVFDQTRYPDEIIVVDDHSTDKTQEILQTYGNRIKYIRMSENGGALITSLTGVKSAQGDICCMLDGDDTWALNKLEIVEKYFSTTDNAILLSHHHIRVDSFGKELNTEDETHQNIKRILAKTQDKLERSNLFVDTILRQKGYWMGSAYSFRRKCFNVSLFEKQIEKFENIKYTYLDMAICPFLVLTNPLGLIGYGAETFFNYRIHSSSSLSNNLTVESAKKSLHRGRSISQLILLLCEMNNAEKIYINHRKLGLLEYDFIESLYTKKYMRAIRLYLLLIFRYWNFQQFLKETKRLLGVVFLGTERFLKIKSKK